jgi:hypothetical protein
MQARAAAFVDQEQVFDYYGFGRYGPAAIRQAVRQTRPQYLLLVGRTTYDYRNYQGANVAPLCPTFLVSTNYWAQATSDALFGDLGHGYPEVAIGRLPVSSVAELGVAVARILAHAPLPESGWRAQAVADVADPAAGDFAAEADGLIAATPEITWTRDYLAITHADVADVTADMTAAANGGADVILYIGHGSAVKLGKGAPAILDVNSVQTWTGNVILLQATCTSAWIAQNVDDYHSLAIQGLTQPGGGLAASLGTSTFMASAPAVAFMTQLLQSVQTSGTWGQALMQTQQWAAQQGDGWSGDLSKTEMLLGDPAMPVLGPQAK